MKKLLFIFLLFMSVTLTGCTNYSDFNSNKLGESCTLASKRYFSFNDPKKVDTALYCIDGIQYISTPTGLSPYINPKAVQNYFENGFKACSCKDEK